MRTDGNRCTAAVRLLYDIHVGAVHESSSLVSGENVLSFNPKRGRKTRGLRQHEYHIKAEQLQYNDFNPSLSGEIDKRNSSTCTFHRNESPPNHVI
ncbi:unnamed protein product [Protopolystoma xenopodis]|uniref:Uncharacterized protein n=1 Tax=Protopolystoma xenopodis TaxID=117903 RepID=A0A3S5A025_9PLAT|nr:unnamed protein product [Protopolystoma xenopodis]